MMQAAAASIFFRVLVMRLQKTVMENFLVIFANLVRRMDTHNSTRAWSDRLHNGVGQYLVY
jgi:hypothetical protein